MTIEEIKGNNLDTYFIVILEACPIDSLTLKYHTPPSPHSMKSHGSVPDLATIHLCLNKRNFAFYFFSSDFVYLIIK